MELYWIIIRAIAGLFGGAAMGALFGTLQVRALRRNQELTNRGEIESGWKVMRASPRRVVWFLLSLVALQIVCPALFVNGTQWWVSGGVVLGYGLVQFSQLSRKRLGVF